MKEKNIALIIILFTIITGLKAQSEITGDEIKEHIIILSSDSFEGRKPGTKGDISSSNYILRDFAKNNLKLMFDGGLQSFELVTDVKLGDNNKMIVDNVDLILDKDFIPFSFSDNSSLKANVCFVGYGFDINEDTLTWKDYNEIDVKDKWVMILRADPELDNFSSVFLPYTQERSKVVVAKDKGAKGVIFVAGKNFDDKDNLTHLSFDKTANNAGIPVLNITRETANKILIDKNIEELEAELNRTYKPNSFELKTIIDASTSIELVKEKSNNIVAMIEGTDPQLKNEFIVIGAHYDHLGWGGSGSGSRMPDTVAVHYGADDNASGVAAILELAEKFVNEKQNKRSIIFVAFGAEEMGLVGSKYFSENPPVDISQIVTMFNFDMVGRLLYDDPYIQIGGTGTAIEFDSIISIYEKDLHLKVNRSADGYGPSDHASFYSNNIPVLYTTSGVHDDYHTPNDNIEKINSDGEKQILDFLSNIINDIANTEKRPSYKESGSKVASRSSRRLKVTLGIVPDVSASDVEGLRITGVRAGGPAESAGLIAKDIIISIGGDAVTNIYDYMFRLAKLKPGETVIVEVKRGDDIKVLLVQL